MAEDRVLVERILAGERKAFAEFVTRYQRLVSHIVYRMVTNEADREDLCQDVFLGIYQNLGSFRFDAKVSTWVARVAYFRCLNYLEKQQTPLYEDLCGEGRTIQTVGSERPGPDVEVERRDIARVLRGEIEKLPGVYRVILTLYHLDEMSYKEIEAITDLPEGTVKSYLFRARKMLKQRLERRYGREELR